MKPRNSQLQKVVIIIHVTKAAAECLGSISSGVITFREAFIGNPLFTKIP